MATKFLSSDIETTVLCEAKLVTSSGQDTVKVRTTCHTVTRHSESSYDESSFGSIFDLICLQDPSVPLMKESGWDFE